MTATAAVTCQSYTTPDEKSRDDITRLIIRLSSAQILPCGPSWPAGENSFRAKSLLHKKQRRRFSRSDSSAVLAIRLYKPNIKTHLLLCNSFRDIFYPCIILKLGTWKKPSREMSSGGPRGIRLVSMTKLALKISSVKRLRCRFRKYRYNF